MIHDGERFEISPFSIWVDDLGGPIDIKQAMLQDKWEKKYEWSGANDIAYRDFLRWNNLHDLDTFSEETLSEATFEITEGEPQIDRKIVYGTIDWETVRRPDKERV
jgi:hypothetical protein